MPYCKHRLACANCDCRHAAIAGFHFLHSKKDIHHEVDLAETAATFDRAFNHCELPSADRKPAFSVINKWLYRYE